MFVIRKSHVDVFELITLNQQLKCSIPFHDEVFYTVSVSYNKGVSAFYIKRFMLSSIQFVNQDQNNKKYIDVYLCYYTVVKIKQ